MARTRSVIIDNTLGRIFRNTPSVSQATAANLIAGSKIESTSFAAGKKVVARVLNNIGTGKGLFFPSGGLITSVQLTAATAAFGSLLTLRLRVGVDYDSSISIQEYQMPNFTKSATFSAAITVPIGQSVFFDITQVGSIKPGQGVGARLSFYRG
jgi:hypothetical protein